MTADHSSKHPCSRRHCQTKFYTASCRSGAAWSPTVFAHESPTRSARFDAENDLYLFALTVPSGAIPGSLHAPYAELMDNIDEGGLIHELAASGKSIVFYCAFGERSAMAVQAAQDKGLTSARHIEGGMAAWTNAGGATR